MSKEPVVFFVVIDQNSNWKAYWDPTLNSWIMNLHSQAAVNIYKPQPGKNYMVTMSKSSLYLPQHYLFQEVTDPTLIDLLEQ